MPEVVCVPASLRSASKMAEVSRRLGKGTYRLLKHSNNYSLRRIEKKNSRGTFLTTVVSRGIRICRIQPQGKQEQAGCACQSDRSIEVCQNGPEMPVIKGTEANDCLPNQPENDFCQLGGGFVPVWSNVNDCDRFSLQDSGATGFDSTLWLPLGCQTKEHFRALEKLYWQRSENLTMTVAQSKQAQDCLYMPLSISTPSTARKDRNFLTADSTIFAETHWTTCLRKRPFCTVTFYNRQSNPCSDNIFLRSRGRVLFVARFRSSNGSPEPPLYRSKTAYYDILEVSPNATHAQIKTAYYKQSFIYHPDKNAGSEEATQQFAKISEAYTVLGNKALKKKYDRGILSQADVQAAGRPSAKESTGSTTTTQQKRSRHSPAAGMAGKPVFDFDEFYKAHYGEQLQREKELRWRREQRDKKKEEGYKSWQLGRMTEMAVGFLVTMAMAILFSMRPSK